MHFQCIDGIRRTTRKVSASLGQHGRDHVFINIDQSDKRGYKNSSHLSKIKKNTLKTPNVKRAITL